MICDALIFKYLEFSHGLTICWGANARSTFSFWPAAFTDLCRVIFFACVLEDGQINIPAPGAVWPNAAAHVTLALQVTEAVRERACHANDGIVASDQPISVAATLENPVVTVETDAAPVMVFNVHEKFWHAVAIEIVRFKFHALSVSGELVL